MRYKFKLLILITSLAASTSAGQQPVAQPTPTPQKEESVVRISTNLVQVDVTVTDKNGSPIRDLRRDEIEIYQNGKKQDISNFSFIEGQNLSTDEIRERSRSSGERPAVLPPATIRPENVKRTIAVVIDDLNLSFADVYFARKAIRKFIDVQMQPGDLIAIIRTGGGIGALQQFSNDKRQLYAAIDRIEWNPSGNAGVGSFSPLTAKQDLGDEDAQKFMEDAQQDAEDFRASVFATGTLGAINYVVRGMADLPGRKSIMLVSQGFSLVTRGRDGFAETNRVLEAIRYLIDGAARAAVVIYSIDPRGLVDASFSAEDDLSGRTMEEITALQSARSASVSDTHDGLRYLSEETGGFAIYNSNDISWGIRKVLDDQNYYLIGYVPDDDTFDPKLGKYNKLAIKVLRAGARVRYRHGFYGVEDLAKVGKPKTSEQRMLLALTSPFSANEVSLRLNALFTYDAKEGPFVRSLLHVDGSKIKVADAPDGRKAISFDIVAVAFGDNGVLVDQVSRTYTITLSDSAAEKLASNGFVYNFVFPIKKPGAYQMRVAIRDHGSDKIGSANQFIEIPNLKKKRLTLSGIALDNFAYDDYKLIAADKSPRARRLADPISATARRVFKRGTVVTYGFSVYNAKGSGKEPEGLTSQLRLLRDGKVIFEGKPLPVSNTAPDQPSGVDIAGSLSLGTEMVPGDYVMQVLVTDDRAKAKYRTASQFVQFQVTE